MIPKKPAAHPAAVDAFISGAAEPPAPAAAQAKTRKKPIRQKEKVLRQTFVINETFVERIEAYAFWQRLTKKQVLEQALQLFFADKKHRAIPRQEVEPEQS